MAKRGIFISYRRSLSSGHAGRLASDLQQRFPGAEVFHDIDSIDPGVDFVDALEKALSKCDLLIVVISPGWAEAKDKKGRRCFDNPNDFVVLEIKAALDRKIRTIPVRVGGAEMPDEEQLPDAIRPLVRRNAFEITDLRWKYDVDQLADAIKRSLAASGLPAAETPPAPEPPSLPGSMPSRPVIAAVVLAIAGIAWLVFMLLRPEPDAVHVSSPPVPAPMVQTISIAHAGPLTGAIAHLGKDDENGVALAIAQANDLKIVIGGRPATFKMISVDDQADPKVGTVVAQKLVDAKVAAVIGHLNSGVAIPASEIYNKAGIPMISGSATNPWLTERGLKTVFRTIGRDDHQGAAIATFIARNLAARRVAIVDDQTTYGELLANGVEKALKDAKVSIVGRERTTDRETNFKALLVKIAAKNPDVVFHGGMDATAAPMLKQARELGMKAVFAFGDGACTDEMGKLAGKAAEDLLCSQTGLPPEVAGRDFLAAFTSKYGEVKQYAAYYYDATNAIIEAMRKANSADPAKFTPAMFNLSFVGATGRVEFDSKGDRRNSEITIYKLKRGKIEPIALVRGKTVLTLDQ